MRRKEKTIARAHDDRVDAQRLTPGLLLAESEYVLQLQDEMKRIDEDLTEAEAKNRLYYLLGERTRCGGTLAPRLHHACTTLRARAARLGAV